MNQKEAIKAIKENDCLAVAMDHKNRTIILIDYEKDLESYSDVIIYTNEDLAESAGIEGLYAPEEFRKKYPKYKNLDYILICQEGWSVKHETWEVALETIDECKL